MPYRTVAPQRFSVRRKPATSRARSEVRDAERGFTLLEVLVALVVLSIGLLGIGKLVMVSSRGNDSAYMRSQATALAYSILDAMRANRAEATTGGYDVRTGTYTGSAGCLSSTCDASALATSDLANWKTNLGLQLPAGDGSVTTANVAAADGTLRTTATITVQWNDWVARQSFAGAAAANNTATVTFETIL